MGPRHGDGSVPRPQLFDAAGQIGPDPKIHRVIPQAVEGTNSGPRHALDQRKVEKPVIDGRLKTVQRLVPVAQQRMSFRYHKQPNGMAWIWSQGLVHESASLSRGFPALRN